MVLESLMNPLTAEKTPSKMLLYGFLFAAVGSLLALWIFRDQASMVMVFLTVIASVPIMYNTIKYEETRDLQETDEKILLKGHWKALKFFMYLFFGFIMAYAVIFIFFPASTVQSLFQTQLETIGQINAKISGNVVSTNLLLQIFFNNFKVLLFCIFFAFFYGAGAIFILTWNASVIGAAIGTFVRDKISGVFSYFTLIPLALVRYMTHGFFEILAYFIGGLAGGIISIAVINHDFESETFKNVLKDSIDLIILAVIILVIAALIEVFITPLFF
ncbi:MAG: stage II sporulation protein M [Nanoarchaeota archaeon]|nr:stage II sporulation protein M [Nanoarchaeota archaeon]